MSTNHDFIYFRGSVVQPALTKPSAQLGLGVYVLISIDVWLLEFALSCIIPSCSDTMEGRFCDLARLNTDTLEVLGNVVGVSDDMAMVNQSGKVELLRTALLKLASKDV